MSVVEAHGMDTIGIYRIPGNTAAVNALRETLSHNMDSVNLEQVDKFNLISKLVFIRVVTLQVEISHDLRLIRL